MLAVAVASPRQVVEGSFVLALSVEVPSARDVTICDASAISSVNPYTMCMGSQMQRSSPTIYSSIALSSDNYRTGSTSQSIHHGFLRRSFQQSAMASAHRHVPKIASGLDGGITTRIATIVLELDIDAGIAVVGNTSLLADDSRDGFGTGQVKGSQDSAEF